MKRFTETTKWRDPWYRRLSPTAKLLWVYLTDHCDCTGTLELDPAAATFDIASPIKEKHLAELGDRVQRLKSGKLFIPRFIHFQYGTLTASCPAHKPILKLVHERNLTMDGIAYQYPTDTLSLELGNSIGKERIKKGKEGNEPTAPGLAEEIYSAYPRKIAKPEAITAILRALKTTDAAFLLDRTRAFAAVRPDKGDQFTPHPATWFNQQRFRDDPSTWVRESHLGNGTHATPRALSFDERRKAIENLKARKNAIFREAGGNANTGTRASYSPEQLAERAEITSKLEGLEAV